MNEVNAASDNATMTIIGNAGDAVVTTDIWEIFGAVNVGGETFQCFESLFGNTTLLVDLDVDISGLQSQQISSESLGDIGAGDGFKIVGETIDDKAGYRLCGSICQFGRRCERRWARRHPHWRAPQ